MKSYTAPLLLVLAICVSAPAAETSVELTVSAGEVDRKQSPVTVLLEAPDDAQTATVTLPDGEKIPAQLTAPGLLNDSAEGRRELHFLLPELAKGKSIDLKATLSSEPLKGRHFVWKDTPGESMELTCTECHRSISRLRYMYKAYDENDHENTYKVFHHVFDPAGQKIITKGAGGQFSHHRGVFFGFNRCSYEGQGNVDTWHCRNGAYLSHEGFLAQEAGKVVGRHTVAVDWHGPDKVFAKEKRQLAVYNVTGGTLIEFTSRLCTTGGKVKLDGDPQHAGFQFRASQKVADGDQKATYYLRPDGKGAPGETRNWPGNKDFVNLPFNAMSFVVDDKRYTCVYLDKPTNPKEARFSERTYGRFGSYFVHELDDDKPLELNYRLWLQEGEMTVEQAAALSADFVQPVEVSVKSDDVPPDGFKALLNGKNLDGWKGLVGDPKTRAKMTPEQLAEAQKKADQKMREHWTVADGVLIFDGKGESLCTVKDYGDFELYVDWKIKPKGDSGIYLRGSPQVQIWDHADGSGGLYNNEKNPSKPIKNADNPVGEWNTFHIKMVGDRVTVRLNGELVVDNVVMENYWERDKPIYPTGQIELQNHGNTLYFKNIHVRELPRK